MRRSSFFNIGLLSGVVLGVLLAPAKGSETRHQLEKQLEGCKKRINRCCRNRHKEIAELTDALENQDAELSPEMRQQLLVILRKSRCGKRTQENETL